MLTAIKTGSNLLQSPYRTTLAPLLYWFSSKRKHFIGSRLKKIRGSARSVFNEDLFYAMIISKLFTCVQNEKFQHLCLVMGTYKGSFSSPLLKSRPIGILQKMLGFSMLKTLFISAKSRNWLLLNPVSIEAVCHPIPTDQVRGCKQKHLETNCKDHLVGASYQSWRLMYSKFYFLSACYRDVWEKTRIGRIYSVVITIRMITLC